MIELILAAFVLSLDSFVASVISGYYIVQRKTYSALIIASVMGFFQGFLLAAGWLGGHAAEKFIADYDHWIAFGLLSAISFKIAWESYHYKTEKSVFNPLQPSLLVGMAVTTSIDAFIVGITFALLNKNIFIAATIIALVTFIMSFSGVIFSIKLKEKINFNFEIFGSLALFLLGIKILAEHLHFF